MDHSKRVELLLPKTQVVDTGGVQSQVSTNQLTGQASSAPIIANTVSPNARLSADTQVKTTGMSNASAQRNADVVAGTAATQFLDTPTGIQIGNKALGKVQPLLDVTGAPVAGKASADRLKQAQANNRLMSSIAYARELLPNATGSGIGAKVDAAGRLIGVSAPGNDEATQLDTIAGWMISNVPRLEGPQSNMDQQLYRQMAAQVGDRTVPVETRLKALDTLEKLMQKYISQNAVSWGPNGPPAAAGTTPASPTIVPGSPASPVRPPISAFGGKR